MSIKVLTDKCTGCKLCVKSCPFGIIEVKDKLAIIGPGCNLCGACEKICKFKAIVIEKEEKKYKQDITKFSGVWVFGEQRHGNISQVVYELIGKAKEIAGKLNEKVSCILIGDNQEENAEKLLYYDIDKIYIIQNEKLKEFHDESYSKVLANLIETEKPSIVLFGATNIGRSFAARVASKIRTGLTADCTGLDIDSIAKNLLQTRPAFGGNIMATILTPDTRPQMATVRHKVFKSALKTDTKKGEKIYIKPEEKDINTRTKFIEFVAELEKTINIADADIIVSGGRGLGKPEGFKLISELATAIGGAVGASRAAVDSGWIPYSHQVGQTGRTVCPKIYIACGISGAIQHLVGMQSSNIIVAINKDINAPIFKIANFGIEGDLYEVIPEIIKKLKN